MKILSSLLNNCRESNRQIGARLEMTGGAVQTRIKRMQECGVIKRFLVNVEPPVLGRGVLYIVVSGRSTDDVIGHASLVGRPYFVVPCIGGITVCGIVIKDDVEWSMQIARKLMRDVRVLSIFEAGDPRAGANLTRTDLEILGKIVEDPRQRISSIARITGMSKKTVSRCLEKLYENNGIKFTLVYDPKKMRGFIAYVVLAWIVDADRLTESIEEINSKFSRSYLQEPFVAKNQIVLFVYGRDVFEMDELTQGIGDIKSVRSVDLFIPKEISFYTQWTSDVIADLKRSQRLHPRYGDGK